MRNDLLLSIEEVTALASAATIETDQIYVAISRDDYIKLAQASGKTIKEITNEIVNQSGNRDSLFRSLTSAACYRRRMANGEKDSYLAANKDMHQHCLKNARWERNLSFTARLPK